MRKKGKSSFLFGRALTLIVILIIISGSGCQQPTAVQSDGIRLETPTIASVFLPQSTSPPPSMPTPLPSLTVPIVEHETWEDVFFHLVYDDHLAPGWELLINEGMEIDDNQTATLHQGEAALAVTPKTDFARLFFAVTKDNLNIYDRSRVLGLSIWLNGGDHWIELSDLAVTVVGSNYMTFWNPNDRSVYIDDKFPFSETRLYFLGFNNAIPPNTWVNVELLLDEREFDPYYNYVTGFYLKNDEGYRHTFYIDDVSLIMVNDEAK
jgi:hypothetical protein